jgi:hypothetical protein
MSKVVPIKEAKHGDFVCKCKKECEDGECKDPKRVREMIGVDREKLQEQIIISAARAGYEAMRVHKYWLNASTAKLGLVAAEYAKKAVWEDLPPETMGVYRAGVMAVILRPELTSAQRHSMWVAQMKHDGWTKANVKSDVLRTDPALVPYDELPIDRRSCDAIFDAVVRAVLGQMDLRVNA